MFIANRWKDYEVIDTSNGEKLEYWGDYKLVRPDPQVIWNTKRDKSWKNINAHYHRSEKGGGNWEFFDLPDVWQIKYNLPEISNPLVFNLKPFSFKHTGVFPEADLLRFLTFLHTLAALPSAVPLQALLLLM